MTVILMTPVCFYLSTWRLRSDTPGLLSCLPVGKKRKKQANLRNERSKLLCCNRYKATPITTVGTPPFLTGLEKLKNRRSNAHRIVAAVSPSVVYWCKSLQSPHGLRMGRTCGHSILHFGYRIHTWTKCVFDKSFKHKVAFYHIQCERTNRTQYKITDAMSY